MKIDKDHIYINVSKDYKILIKNTLNGTWSAKHNAWRFPKSVYVLNEIAHYLPNIARTDAFIQGLKQLEVARAILDGIKNTSYDIIPGDNLRPYQRQDVQYLMTIPNAAILNQPRTGKTPTLIETIKKKATRRNLIITPASLQNNWIRELKNWHADSTIYHYSGTPKERAKIIQNVQSHAEGPLYLIVSKDTARRELPMLVMHWDTLTVDEAHFLRNRQSAQSKAINILGKHAKHRYVLTGTPTVKHPSEIFGILEFLYPTKWSSYWQFLERYFYVDSNGFGKEIGNPIKKREAELKDFIDAISTQRLRKDVMQWLPDKQYHKHMITLGTKQQKVYQDILEDFFTEQEDGTELDVQNVLTQLLRLRQITLDPKLVGLNTPSAKTEALLDILENNVYTENNEPIIVMSMFTSFLKMIRPEIESLGKRVGMIHGEMSNKEKDDTAQSFQRGEIDVLLCNIISAGTGFTLDRGEVIIFTDKAWNPSDNEQAEDRITPTKEENVHNHFVVSLVCENTIDVHIENVLWKKESLTSLVNKCKSVDQLRRLFV